MLALFLNNSLFPIFFEIVFHIKYVNYAFLSHVFVYSNQQIPLPSQNEGYSASIIQSLISSKWQEF